MSSKNDFNRFVLPDNLTQDWLFNVGDAVAVGDLMYDNGSDVARPADKLTTLATEALDQAQFAQKFIGVSQEQVLSTETNALKRITLRVEAVCEFKCPSQTFNKGDLIGVYSDGTALDPQQVDLVTHPALAIGQVVKYYSAATTRVRCRIISRKTWDLASSWAGSPSFFDGQAVAVTAAADAALVLTVGSNPVQKMTPTADRVVTLPAVGQSKGLVFFISNLATSQFYLNVKNAGGTFIGIVGPGETGVFVCDGATWYGIVSGAAAGGAIQVASTQVVSKTADYPLVASDSGTNFDNTGAAGSVNFTLPAVASSKGFFCSIFGVVDQPIVVTAPAGTLVGPNNAGRTTYTDAGAGNRIGVSRYAYCNGAKWFLLVDVKGLTIGTYA